ncbi:hypothetical protein JB92DRAFT_2838455 [Gautieria morchelliformis]|nr:hypothetical protein JB92DRAFT_2838455 [Gautieria morchelliformis]
MDAGNEYGCMERRAKVLREGGSFSVNDPHPLHPVKKASALLGKSQTRHPAKQPPPNHGAIKTPTSETRTKEARKEPTTHPVRPRVHAHARNRLTTLTLHRKPRMPYLDPLGIEGATLVVGQDALQVVGGRDVPRGAAGHRNEENETESPSLRVGPSTLAARTIDLRYKPLHYGERRTNSLGRVKVPSMDLRNASAWTPQLHGSGSSPKPSPAEPDLAEPSPGPARIGESNPAVGR